RIASNHLVEVIRLVKYLRDTKGTFSVKSVILTTLLGKAVNHARVWGDPDYYADMPTTLYHVLRDLDAELQANPTLPRIEDPGCPSEDFNHRWDEEGYANFREKLHYYSDKVTAAYEEPDKATSLALWQEVFGPSFQAPPKAPTRSATLPAVPETEQWLESDLGIPTISTRFRLKIKGNVLAKNGFRHGTLSTRGNRVHKGRGLRFTIEACDVPKPYEVYWKVRNTGEEAAKVGQLRGEITRDQGLERRDESTSYRGSHYVECYIVKDGVCVASDKQLVFVL
ncbi:MAG: nucleotide-binding domain-containing protein, partial [Gaiellaceae bacterium]